MARPKRNQRVLRTLRQAVPSGVLLGRRSAGEGPVEFIPLDESISALLDDISAVQGSVLYRGASGWAALAPGTSGDVLTTQGPAANPIWSPAGGSGNGLWWFDPPAAADFGTSVTEGAGVSGVSLTDDADVGLIYVANITSTDHASARVQTPPSTPFTITAHLYHHAGSGGVIGNAVAGIILRDADTGLRTVYGFTGSAGVNGLGIRRATGTTFNANLAISAMSAAQHGLWLRVVVTTDTNIEYKVSPDGKTWNTWQADTANGRVSGLDQIGLGITRSGTTTSQILVCDYWNVA